MSKRPSYQLISGPPGWTTQAENNPVSADAIADWEIIPHPTRPQQGWLRHRVSGQSKAYVLTTQGATVRLWLDGEDVLLERVQPQKAGATGGATTQGAFTPTLKAPMPGKIIALAAQAGDVLAPQQAVVVMESMKMELSITTPTACRVESIHCDIGQLVDMNAVLAQLSPIPESNSP